jgi:hypothetical protein
MARSNRTKVRSRVSQSRATPASVKASGELELASVAWVGWQIRRGEKYFGVVQRADGTVERTRLERDDLQAAADFVTAHIQQNDTAARGRKVRRSM